MSVPPALDAVIDALARYAATTSQRVEQTPIRNGVRVRLIGREAVGLNAAALSRAIRSRVSP